MKNIDTDKIIGSGLIVALLLKIIGDVVIIICGFEVPAGDLATNIVACLAGYMGRSLLEKIRHGGYYNDDSQPPPTDRRRIDAGKSDSSRVAMPA